MLQILHSSIFHFPYNLLPPISGISNIGNDFFLILIIFNFSSDNMGGNNNLSGRRILVQGVGNVGEHLVKYLSEEGAEVIINDINENKLVDPHQNIYF